MKEIPLNHGFVALVDDDDFENVNQFKWFYCQGYAHRNHWIGNGRSKTVLMHRFIMNVDGAVDHRNRDPLDNRRENLRVATKAENMRNRGATVSSTSGFKGVTWDKYRQKYKAQIKVDYRNIFLGRFNDMKEAAKAYNDAALHYFGGFAWLNPL